MNDFADIFDMGEPERESEVEVERTSPAWLGPAEDELGTVLPASRVIGRSDNAVIALRSIVVFSTGLNFDLVAVARGVSRTKAGALLHGLHGFDSEGEIPDSFIRVGVKYADGTRVSNAAGMRRIWQAEKEPDGPVLLQNRSGGSQAGGGRVIVAATHWLWPLPPPDPLEFFVEWPALQVALSSSGLDGRAIAQAAGESRSFWA